MDTSRNKWIFLGSLGIVFVITSFLSYGPNYGSNLLAVMGISRQNVTNSPEMSQTDMVTGLVTTKKLVTNNIVTNVTNVSPTLSPIIYSQYDTKFSPLVSVTPRPSLSPSASQTPSPTSMVTSVTPTPPPTSSPVATSSPLVSSPTSTPVPTQSEKININTAGLAELDNITGVGPVIAQRIIDYRTAHGPFLKIEDIIEVKGIGDATFQKMKDEITVGP